MVAAERRVDLARARGRAALDEGHVLAGHLAGGDHRAQRRVRLAACGRRRAGRRCPCRAGGRSPGEPGPHRRRAGRRAPRRASARVCRAPDGRAARRACRRPPGARPPRRRAAPRSAHPDAGRPAVYRPSGRGASARRTRRSRRGSRPRAVISTSARLKAGQGRRSTKSVTAPSRIRSIRLPTAPPASRPIGSQSPGRLGAREEDAEQRREGDRGEDEDERAGVVEQPEGDAAVADADEVEMPSDRSTRSPGATWPPRRSPWRPGRAAMADDGHGRGSPEAGGCGRSPVDQPDDDRPDDEQQRSGRPSGSGRATCPPPPIGGRNRRKRFR